MKEHRTRASDASTFDIICTDCGATDRAGDNSLSEACPGPGKDNVKDMRNPQTIWDQRFMDMAAVAASWSKDPSTKCGAVIVDPLKRVVSLGFNGFPRTIYDDPKMLEDRDVKYKVTIHAEINAILFAKRDVTDCTIYVHESLPCGQCAALIAQAGIKTFVARLPFYETPEREARWLKDHALARSVLSCSGVRMRFGCPRCINTHDIGEACLDVAHK